jgi:hypothetical protein
MFKVQAKGFSQEFDRWVDALETAKLLQPKCGWFDEVRILERGELVWTYSKGYKYPRFIGAGVYDRLARRFVMEMSHPQIADVASMADADRIDASINDSPPITSFDDTAQQLEIWGDPPV